jgi:hypothetical protein
MLRWQLAGMLVGFALALLAAVLDARRNGPLSLQGNVLPMARLVAVGTLASVPVSAMLCWGWVAAAQRVVVLEQRALLRSLGLGLVGGLQALLCFVFGALLTGRFAEVWAITDRFLWLPGVPRAGAVVLADHGRVVAGATCDRAGASASAGRLDAGRVDAARVAHSAQSRRARCTARGCARDERHAHWQSDPDGGSRS